MCQEIIFSSIINQVIRDEFKQLKLNLTNLNLVSATMIEVTELMGNGETLKILLK